MKKYVSYLLLFFSFSSFAQKIGTTDEKLIKGVLAKQVEAFFLFISVVERSRNTETNSNYTSWSYLISDTTS